MHISHRGERGAALLLVIMALILVTAIGLAMLFASDTETAIAANYRDKQVAMYAAQAGLQEARDRINPAHSGDPLFIDQPGGLASAAAANVIYIINPADASETINPWDPSSPYYDYNFCNTVPSLCSGTPLRPSATSGYKVYNNQANTKPDGSTFTNPYHLVTGSTYTPLKYKWVRIILKADNSTPVHINGSNAGTQVCWDDGHKAQIQKPAGYDIDCTSAGGSLLATTPLTLTSGGSGYTSAPSVTIGPPPAGGTQAVATAIITSVPTDTIESVSNTPGSGYTSAPTVTIDPPPNILSGGVQATAVATIANGGAPLTSVSLADKGGCYQNATPIPMVNITGGGGSGASATATMGTTKSCVFSWTASGTCSAQKGKTLNITGTGGFAGTVTFKNGTGAVNGTSVTNPGTGLSGNPTPLAGLSGCTITPSFTLGYQVASVAMNAGGGGNGYTSVPTVKLSAPGIGAAPTGTATLGAMGGNAGQLLSIKVTNPGSGYTSDPIVTLWGGGGTGATATAHRGTTSSVTGFNISNFGAGYVTAPTVTIGDPPAGPGHTTATATANLNPGDYYGTVFLLTSFARANGGSIAMNEMEIANLWPPPFVSNFYKVPGAMTLAGPNPQFVPPNSMNMVVSGNDANSCGETSLGAKPALGVYDDPNNPPVPPALTAVQSVTNAVSSNGAKPQNYQGINATADVHNVYSSVGDPATASAGLQGEVDAIAQYPNANVYGDPSTSAGTVNGCSGTVSVGGCVPLGTPGHDVTNVVYGDLNIGPLSGSGILVVTGTLTMSGNFNYSGVILVIGEGKVVWNGGGNGQITGAVYIANIHGGSGQLLSPDADWSGGGGNGIRYDHCRADNLLKPISAVPRPLNLPMLVLSTRSIGNQ